MAKNHSLKTNDKIRSCLKEKSDVRACIDFKTLWLSHPLNWDPPEPYPFRKEVPKKKKKASDNPFGVLFEEEEPPGEPIYQNQCAIKMSVALHGAGIYLDTYPKARSELRFVKQLNMKIRGALAAEELAVWLCKAIGNPETYKNGEGLDNVRGRTGIVFFKDYWQRQPNGPLDGDHIDLWNGETTPNVSSSYHELPVSAFQRSAEVWFWEVQ